MTILRQTKKSHIALLPDLPGLFCLSTFILLLLLGGKRILSCPDTLWHIRAGAKMIEQAAVLKHDIFSHTAYGKAWIAHEWLAEVIMAFLHQTGGLAAVVIFYAFLTSLTFWILLRICCRYAPDWLATLSVLSAFSLATSHLLARPHLFSWFFGALTLAILHEGSQSRWRFLLPPITMLWANLHGGFVLSILLQGFFITGPLLERILSPPRPPLRTLANSVKQPLLILAASIIATGINPFGYHLLLFPFYVSSNFISQLIDEWRAPNLQQDWYLRLYFLLTLFILFFHARRINWTGRLFILYFINAALAHYRHISLAGIFLCPIWAETLSPWANKLKIPAPPSASRKQLSLSSRSGVIATVFFFLLTLTASGSTQPAAQELRQRFFAIKNPYPVEAINFLKTHRPAGKMFNNYAWGGLLIYEFGPELKVFIDGRADMYGKTIMHDYLKIINVSGQTDDLLKTYGIDWVIFKSSAPLIAYLKAGGRWQEMYQDKTASILVRVSPTQTTNPS